MSAAFELNRRGINPEAQTQPAPTAPTPTPTTPSPAASVSPDQVQTLSDDALLAVYNEHRGKAGPMFVRAALELKKRGIDPNAGETQVAAQTGPVTPATEEEVQEPPLPAAKQQTDEQALPDEETDEDAENINGEQDAEVAPEKPGGISDGLRRVASVILGGVYTSPSKEDQVRLRENVDILEESYQKIRNKPSSEMTDEELDTVDAYQNAKDELDDATSELPFSRLLGALQNAYEGVQSNPNRVADAKELRGLIDETNRHLQNRQAQENTEDHRTMTVKEITPKIHAAQNKGLTLEEIENDPRGAGERFGLKIEGSHSKGRYLVEGRTMTAKQLTEVLGQNEENARAEWAKTVNDETARGLARRAVDLDADTLQEGAWNVHHVEDGDGNPHRMVFHTPTGTKFIYPESELEGVEPAKPGKRGQSFVHNEETDEVQDAPDSVDEIFDEAVEEGYGGGETETAQEPADAQPDNDIDGIFDEAVEEGYGESPANAPTGKEKVRRVKTRAKAKKKTPGPKKDMTKKRSCKEKSQKRTCRQMHEQSLKNRLVMQWAQ